MSTTFQITVDCADAEVMAEFWSRALGYVPMPPPEGYDTWDDFATAEQLTLPPAKTLSTIVDPDGVGPAIRFVAVDTTEGREVGFNFDLRPGDDEAKESLVNELSEHGGRIVRRNNTPDGWWVVMRDPGRNEFSVF